MTIWLISTSNKRTLCRTIVYRRPDGRIAVVGIDKRILLQALRLGMKDFEDAVQLSAAASAEIDCVITRNTKDFGSASLEVIEPKDFLKNHR